MHVFPDTKEAREDALGKVQHAFMYDINRETGEFQGYQLRAQDGQVCVGWEKGKREGMGRGGRGGCVAWESVNFGRISIPLLRLRANAFPQRWFVHS